MREEAQRREEEEEAVVDDLVRVNLGNVPGAEVPVLREPGGVGEALAVPQASIDTI